ncbi:Carboxylesterase [Mactra antiquata]
MKIRYIVISFAFLMIIGTQCQYKPHHQGTCKMQKNQIGRTIIEMSDRSKVQGTRVDFSSGDRMDYSPNSCDLKSVFEFRGLKYGEVMSGTKVLRFFTSRTPGRAIELKHFATNFRPVCPQKRMSYAAYGLPQSVWYRWVNKTGVLTENQSEECLWINLYLPHKHVHKNVLQRKKCLMKTHKKNVSVL